MSVKNNKLSWIDKEIKKLKKEGLFTKIHTIQSPVGSQIKVDGKKVLNFCSNNYLGLANDKRLKKAATKAIEKYGVGPAAVRTISGNTSLHDKLEAALAKFKKTESSITFQSGFNANLATIPALVGKKDVIFSDELNHASIIDGCRLSGAKVVRYKHCDVKSLEKKIKKIGKFQKALLVTDGVFSMDGDLAPLPKLSEISEKHNLILMVDDAHGEGVLGENGRGIVDQFGLHGQVDIEVGTMSKAFGVVGGYVAANKKIVEWLKQSGRPFLFSSAMTIPDTASCLEAVKILKNSDKLVSKLWKNTDYFKEKMSNLGFDTGKSETPIVPIMLGDAKLAQKFSKKLFKSGVFATSIGYPTVPKNKARIRVMISAAHKKKDLDKALYTFEKVGKNLKVIQ